MRCLLFLLLFNFALTSVTTDPTPTINIYVTRGENNKFQTEIKQSCCVINFSEPFKVMVHMPSQVKKKIECHNSRNERIISENLQKDGEGDSVTIREATAFMATDWQCGFDSSSKIYTRSFKVHVRGQSPTLYINNNNITSYSTGYTTLDYDEYAVHRYIDGEMTSFKCVGYKGSYNSQILCQNKVTDRQLEVVGYEEAVLHLRLTKEYNDTSLDCKVTERKEDGLITNTIRVFFQMETASHIPRFMINEMVLPPVKSSSPDRNSNSNRTFVYDYYDNENVIIKTVTGNSSSLKCSINQLPFQTVKAIKLNITLNERYNNLKLTCAMKDNQQDKDVTSTLNFKRIEASNTKLYGLSWANVLAKYKKSNGDIVIKYSYRGNRLLLTCHASDKQIRWEYDKKQMISTIGNDYYYSINGSIFRKTQWFEMKTNYNKSTIKCYQPYKPPYTDVELIRNGPRELENIPETDLLEYFNSTRNNIISSVAPSTHARTNIGNKPDDVKPKVTTTSTPNYSTPRREDADEESFFGKNKKLLLICAAAILVIIVIAITICLIMKRLKQKRIEQAILSNINYENLPEHNDGPMPIPPQWQCKDDDVTYSTPDVGKSIDDLYAKPLPKDQRSSKTTPIYAEAYDYANTSGADYVNTGSFIRRKANVGKDNSNYSEVYQSNKEVDTKNKIKYANIDQLNETYAQVEPKILRDCNNIENLKEHCYGNLNVTYNKSSNPYSEPAYAEIKQ